MGNTTPLTNSLLSLECRKSYSYNCHSTQFPRYDQKLEPFALRPFLNYSEGGRTLNLPTALHFAKIDLLICRNRLAVGWLELVGSGDISARVGLPHDLVVEAVGVGDRRWR